MIVYPVTYRVPVKIGELTFWISPMKVNHKIEVLSLRKRDGGEEIDSFARPFLILKYSLKEVEGLQTPDGNPYSLPTDNEGHLTEEALSDLSQLDSFVKLIEAASSLMNAYKPVELPGVSIDFNKGKLKKN